MNTSSALSYPTIQAELLNKITQLVPSTLTGVASGEPFVKVSPAHLIPLLTILKDHTGREFTQLRDITAVDNPERKHRFEVVYSLLSVRTAQRLAVLVSVAEGESLPSATSLYASAGWYERELWDRFGVVITGHPDLRRRLTDYGFRGHPLRKDFPVTGYTEVRYHDGTKRIVYEGVSLAQQYRLFTLDSPWSTV
jgi:NADH/F420H2 dehydrogenase subunit C